MPSLGQQQQLPVAPQPQVMQQQQQIQPQVQPQVMLQQIQPQTMQQQIQPVADGTVKVSHAEPTPCLFCCVCSAGHPNAKQPAQHWAKAPTTAARIAVLTVNGTLAATETIAKSHRHAGKLC